MDRTYKLTGAELQNIENKEGIELNQGESKPMYIFGECIGNNIWGEDVWRIFGWQF